MSRNNRNSYETGMKIKAVLFIIVFLLMIAVIISLLDGMGIELFAGKDKEAPKETSPAGQSVQQEPSPDPVIPDNTTEPVAAPDLTPAAAPTPQGEPKETEEPEPEPEPTETPKPPEEYGKVIGSGTVRSNTGVGLNIIADWTAVTKNETQTEVTITVSLESFSIGTISNPLTISVGGKSETVTAPSVTYDGAAGMKKTELAVRSFLLDLGAGESLATVLSASWVYNGTYSGKELAVIECSEALNLQR